MSRDTGHDDGLDALRSMIALVDLPGDRLDVVSGTPADPRAVMVVRKDGYVVDILEFDAGPFGAERAREAAPAGEVQRAWRRGAGDGLSASIVICTLGRSSLLTAAVEAALSQTHADLEVVVVDNAPRTGQTRSRLRHLEDPRLRVVAEPAAGLSRARNTGVSASHGEIIAFTDDDAVTDPRWLAEILDVFGSDSSGAVGAVTGNPLPARLQHPAQRYFEARGGFPRTTRPVLWTLGAVPQELSGFGEPGRGGPLYPVTTARVGAGVAMAFRRRVLEEIGPFDVRLGAGTRTAGGEDLDAFSRVLHAGHAIVQTPDALVWHTHRPTLGGLRTQIKGNGSGMAALVTKAVLADPRRLATLVSRVPAVARRLAPGSERVVGRDPDVPRSLTRIEAIGFLQGPALFLAEAHRARRSARRATG